MIQSKIQLPANTDFPVENIPFGIFKTANQLPRVATRIGDTVVDLFALANQGAFEGLGLTAEVFAQNYLNPFISLGKATTNAVRVRLQELFTAGHSSSFTADSFHAVDAVELLLPVQIGDYTDFFSSREHATNTGMMFRDPENALLPNWLHIPVGYHGRSSSIVISGTPVRRPKGQTEPSTPGAQPNFGPSRLLDFELELGFVIGKNNDLGTTISTAEAEDYIFGLALFNDWSARDIQRWEYVPLGPFLSKNFASSLSPWIVTMEALEVLRTAGPEQNPAVLPYLEFAGDRNFDIQLEVDIVPENGQGKTVSKSNSKYLYWNMCQQLAHHTINGCNMVVGDLCASGTISGPTPESYGSMLEISWRGTRPVAMPDGTERRFILDGDMVVMRGFGITPNGVRIGFGEVSGKVLPAN